MYTYSTSITGETYLLPPPYEMSTYRNVPQTYKPPIPYQPTESGFNSAHSIQYLCMWYHQLLIPELFIFRLGAQNDHLRMYIPSLAQRFASRVLHKRHALARDRSRWHQAMGRMHARTGSISRSLPAFWRDDNSWVRQ